ncbi:hypothetical protein HAV15_002960 [Penicillium sp. str. |nr:hypothetical protein HAV15_002960 [Penicillium sp. str. \
MTLTRLESGLQDAKSQDNPDSGNTSTVVNRSIQPRPEKNAMVHPTSLQVDPKPISNFIKENSGGQPTQDEEDPSSQLLSDSDELRHSDTIGCCGRSNGINHKPQTTYTFKDCTFDGTSMLFIGSARTTSGTVVLRDSNSGRAIFVNGDMDKDRLREFCEKKK